MDFWEREQGFRSVLLKREYIDITGSLPAAILLSQLAYWFRPGKNGKPKLTIVREGRYWLAKTREEWQAECGLSPRMYRSAIADLTASGIVSTRFWKFGGRPTTHYALELSVLSALLDFYEDVHLVDSTTSTLSEGHGLGSQLGNLHLVKSSSSLYTEITAGITASNTSTAAGSASGGSDTEDQNLEIMMSNAKQASKLTGSTIAEVMANLKKKKETVGSAGDSLRIRWKKEYTGKYDGFFQELTKADEAKLGRIGVAIGKEKALDLLTFVIRKWDRFAVEVKSQKGLASAPERPAIGFLSTYYGVGVDMMLKAATEASKGSGKDGSYLVETTTSTLSKGQGSIPVSKDGDPAFEIKDDGWGNGWKAGEKVVVPAPVQSIASEKPSGEMSPEEFEKHLKELGL